MNATNCASFSAVYKRSEVIATTPVMKIINMLWESKGKVKAL